MKAVILCGGVGSRLQEETASRPKPMVEIGGRPILWHILKHFAHHGFREFVLALGYKGDVIKDYFLRYRERSGNLSINLGTGDTTLGLTAAEDWLIHLVDTGELTLTGGRLTRLSPYLSGEPFLMTYGDGVGDVDLPRVVEFHRRHRKWATVTAVRPPARFGALTLRGSEVQAFAEKPDGETWINGGFFVCEPQVLAYTGGDGVAFESTPLEALARDGQLMAYRHDGFWHCMDTLRDRQHLESLWSGGRAPWATWNGNQRRKEHCDETVLA